MFTVPGLEVDYRPEAGVHKFELADGEVTVVSANNWDIFVDKLETLDTSTPGTVLSPELITSAGTPLVELSETRDQIEERCEQVRELSAQFPAATLLLGSAAWSAAVTEPTNSLLAFRAGQELVDQKYDKRLLTPGEHPFFRRGGTPRPGGPRQVAICADMIKLSGEAGRVTSPITRDTHTVLASTCWAVPMEAANPYETRPHFQRFAESLGKTAAWLFGAYPQLQDLVVADRSIALTNLPPFNAHISRR